MTKTTKNDVIRKCNERGEFEPVIDDETIEILSALLPIANDLGIGEAWQNMLQEKSMRSLSVAADAANAVKSRKAGEMPASCCTGSVSSRLASVVAE